MLHYLTTHIELTNAIAATASAVAAIFALVVSVRAVAISEVMFKHQRQHDVLSVRPIPEITMGDYENSIRVKLCNHGSGPMIVKRVCVQEGSLSKPSLVAWMPELPHGIEWTDFVGQVVDRSLLPGQKMVLVQLDGDIKNTKFQRARDATRAALARLTVQIEYRDIYESTFPPYTKSLEWFARAE